VAILQRGPA